MKPNTLPKCFPATAEEWERLIEQAPESVTDPDCPYDPNDAAAVAAFWDNAIVSHSLPELREKLAARRRGRPVQGEPKTAISLRLPVSVLDAWKASGPGWQTRMVEDLSRHAPV